jgi:hypothetical protein
VIGGLAANVPCGGWARLYEYRQPQTLTMIDWNLFPNR